MRGRSALMASVCAIAGALAVPATSAATHKHVVTTGNGSCVILAPNGKESGVILPDAALSEDPTVNVFPHPLHVNVHRGAAGQHIDIAVLGSTANDCPSYLNGP